MKLRLPSLSLSLRSQLLLIAVGGFVVGHMLNWLLASGLGHLHGGYHFFMPVSLLTFVALLAAVAWLAARVTRPLKRLTESADKFSGAAPLQPLKPEGPPDMRRAIEAFNGLSRRISDLLDEKDQMLGALGHDLRTPLASIRIRAASMRPVAERTALFSTVDGMERMIEDILTLARTGRSAEPLARVDVRALLLAVVGEFNAQGAAVELEPGEVIVWALRPELITRALRNLVDNAVRYGGAARLGVAAEGQVLIIRVEDEGPGLPGTSSRRSCVPSRVWINRGTAPPAGRASAWPSRCRSRASMAEPSSSKTARRAVCRRACGWAMACRLNPDAGSSALALSPSRA